MASYTSPHILKFNERIKINNKEVDDKTILKAFNYLEQAREQQEITFFELTTLAALYIFKQAKVDVVILEVGLGGRLDAVNVVKNNVAVITSIGIDHTQYLGTNLEEIAAEKAGIIKEDTDCVVVSNKAKYSSVLDKIKSYKAESFIEGKDFNLHSDGILCKYMNNKWNNSINSINTKLLLPSVSLALAVTDFLQTNLDIDKGLIIKGLLKASILARQQIINYNGTKVVLDLSHNPAGSSFLADFLAKNSSSKAIVLWHSYEDKDLSGIVSNIKDRISYWCITECNEQRAASLKMLKDTLLQQGITEDKILAKKNSVDAINLALSTAAEQNSDLVIFGGFAIVSNFLEFKQALVEV